MKLLITGATGFLGSNLCKFLSDKGYHVTALTRSESYEQRDSLVCKEVWSIDELLINPDRLESYDGIIHLASHITSDENLTEIQKTVDANITLGLKLLSISSSKNVKWMIHAGTYWQNYNSPTYSPVNLYAASKQAFHDLGQYFAEAKKVRFFTLKLTDTYGPNDKRKKILNHLWQCAQDNACLDLTPGNQKIDLYYIDDVCRAFEKLIEHVNATNQSIGTYTLGSKNQKTLREIVSTFTSITKLSLNINWGGKEYREREILIPNYPDPVVPNWHPLVSLEEGILKSFNVQK